MKRILSMVCFLVVSAVLAAGAECFLTGLSVMQTPPREGKSSRVMLEISGSGWEENSTVHILTGTTEGSGNVRNYEGVIVREEEGMALLLQGEKSLLQGDKFRIGLNLEPGLGRMQKFITVYCKSQAGKESNKVSKPLQ